MMERRGFLSALAGLALLPALPEFEPAGNFGPIERTVADLGAYINEQFALRFPDKITHLQAFGDHLYVFTEREVWRLDHHETAELYYRGDQWPTPTNQRDRMAILGEGLEPVPWL